MEWPCDNCPYNKGWYTCKGQERCESIKEYYKAQSDKNSHEGHDDNG